MTVLEKEALWKGTGAAAVDMESGVAAEVANYHKLPFAVLEGHHRSRSSLHTNQRSCRGPRKRHN